MEVDPADIELFLTILTQTPGRISTIALGIDNARLNAKSTDADWSANDILAHLRACADMWGKSMLAMIKQDHPTLRYVSPRTWIRKTKYQTLEFSTSLVAFTSQRMELLQSLRSLPIEEWSRGATFKGTTRGREQTIFDYARRMALHESEHCEQLEEVLRST